MLTDGSSYCGQISDQRETSAVVIWFVALFMDQIRRGTFYGYNLILSSLVGNWWVKKVSPTELKNFK
jgi:hypothetical protein